MVIGDNTYVQRAGIAVGDKLTFEISGRRAARREHARRSR